MANNKPVKEIRTGFLKAAIWKNEADGKTFYNVTFCRSYKQGDDWKETDSFGADDLPTLKIVAHLAFEWVYKQREAKREAARQEGGDRR